MITRRIDTNSVKETLTLAETIGSRLKGGEIIELIGDLGSGKTTFVSGVATGAKSQDVVSSPTFMISKIYKTPKLNIYHFDFYRLNESDLAIHELTDAMDQNNAVILIEWPGVVDDLLKEDKVTIKFSYLPDINKRRIEMKYDLALEYLFN
jgi:tRNA threonylcarbamoyladenosine biosynthesis protein TsaE